MEEMVGATSPEIAQMEMPSDESNLNNSEAEMRNMNVDSSSVINILLFGETGVGKSTFINSFTNYLKFSDLPTAMENELHFMIPSKFTMMNENYESAVIQIGTDENECTNVGASGTQYCRTYSFPKDKFIIQIIDTPGIADTKGVNKDNSNLEHILSFISDMKQLNAICVLLQPNVSRLTVQFEYCIKQLLSRLDKSASNNLVFVFTNTRGTFYRPGETLPTLKTVFEGIRNATIPLSIDNMFCLDNEGFRFLAAYKSGIKFNQQSVNTFSDSWDISSLEVWRMINYIAGGGPNNNVAIQPHMVQNTISINEARRLVIQLSRPMAEIAQLIQDNILLLNKHNDNLQSSFNDVTELKKKLYIPFIDLIVTKLDKPTTVCTTIGCSELYQVNDVQKWHYKQRCHDPCYLQKVPNEIIGSPELTRCWAMATTDNSCKICKCSYKKHMHIYYTAKTVPAKIENKDVHTKIKSSEMATITAQDLIDKTKLRIEEYENERETILKTTAQFAHFLQENAITPYNDAYQSYLLYLIDREKSFGVHTDRQIINDLIKMLAEYEEEKLIVHNALKQSDNVANTINDANTIISKINDLYNLKHTGKKIKELIDSSNAARKEEINTYHATSTYQRSLKYVKKIGNQCIKSVSNKFQSSKLKNPNDF